MSEPRLGRFLEIDGRTVHVIDEGDGEPVVLLHGWGSLAQEVIAGFSGLDGFRLIAPDRPGYGFSDPIDGELRGPDAQAVWLGGVLDALELDAPILAGHSFGASVAASFATSVPDRVSRLMLIAPFCRPTRYPATIFVHFAASAVGGPIRSSILPALLPVVGPSRMAAVLAPTPVPDYLADFPYAHLVRDHSVLSMAAEIGAFNGCMARWPAVGGHFPGPVSIVAGAKDTVAVPDWHVSWLTEHMPQAEVILLDEAGHAPHHMAEGPVKAELRRLAARSDVEAPTVAREPLLVAAE